jgi:AraC-like DNA-binding protein
MDAIPLIRARYLQAFAAAVERTGVRPQRLLEAVKIPVGILENPDALHPAQQLFDFAGQAARVTGQTDLGLVAGRTKLEDHGAFGNRVSGAPTLHQALETFCSEALKEYSRAFFSIERRGDDIWFCREKIDGQKDGRQQIELYLVEIMLQTIRQVTGPGWQPGELWLQSLNERVLRDFEPLTQLNVRFGCPILAIPIPKSVMSKTLPRNGRQASRAAEGSCEQTPPKPPAADFVGSLREVIVTYLPGRHAKIEAAAAAAGMSVRSLQRRLASEGLTFSQLVDEVRLEMAVPQLRDPDIRLTDIALCLGYSDPAHFTRAFGRWAGVSPSEYRAHQLVN